MAAVVQRRTTVQMCLSGWSDLPNVYVHYKITRDPDDKERAVDGAFVRTGCYFFFFFLLAADKSAHTSVYIIYYTITIYARPACDGHRYSTGTTK